MIALGLGSNLGDRVDYLRFGIRQLTRQNIFRELQISRLYESQALLPPGAPPDWNQDFLNLVVVGETSLEPEALLAAVKNIELLSGRDLHSPRWSPRSLDIDILTWHHDEKKFPTLTLPHPELMARPFALLPLADLLPEYCFTPTTPPLKELRKKWEPQSPLKNKVYRKPATEIVGVLNLTPDSFSDGGQFNSVETALTHVEAMMHEGASVIDIGAQSTRPNAEIISATEEWQRLEPTLTALRRRFPRLRLSLDTQSGEIARRAIAAGVHWFNDVSAFTEPEALKVATETKADLVFMHHLTVPPTAHGVVDPEADIIKVVLSWARERIDFLVGQGISRERLIFDPGIGFGKTAEHNLELITGASDFHELGVRTLVGHSRKSFLKKLVAAESSPLERDLETAGLTSLLAESGVDFVRVHNVSFSERALKLSALTHGVFL